MPNPYEQAISIIGKTLSTFDEDNLIPCFGFGDGNSFAGYVIIAQDLMFIVYNTCLIAALTHDKDVFSFYHDERPCHGFEEALSQYREIAAQVNLAGLAYMIITFLCLQMMFKEKFINQFWHQNVNFLLCLFLF